MKAIEASFFCRRPNSLRDERRGSIRGRWG